MNRSCDKCGNPLSGKQQRFCSKLCRNIVAGRHSTPRYQIPSRDWLASKYLLPPEGEGLSLAEIGGMLGTTDVTVGNWVKKYGFTQDPNKRLSHFASRPNPKRRSPMPDRDNFARHYLMPPDGEGMSHNELAEIYGVSRPTVARWISEFGLIQPFSERHSTRMSDSGNPAYLNGTSENYLIRKLAKGKAKVCDWCGTTEKVQVHHIDHDHDNGNESNLMWLCGPCNRLEAQLWQLEQVGRARRHFENNQLVIEFIRSI